MPYQFGEGAESISLLDSSEDEDEIITPTSHRSRRECHNWSTGSRGNTDLSENSDEPDTEDIADFVANDRAPRTRLHSSRTINLEREIEELDSTSREVASASDSGEEVLVIPRSNARHREEFKKTLNSIESSEDIRLLYPKSLHANFQYQELIADEHEVLKEFIPDDASDEQDQNTFEELQVHDFSIYRGILHQKGFSGQFESPHIVCSEEDSGVYYLDGIVSHEGAQKRIIGAVIYDVNIGGLNDIATHTSVHHIWVQTKQSRRRQDCWYRLSDPSNEYTKTWSNFVWLADLNKHVIDYLEHASMSAEKVHLHHFKAAFWAQLFEWHGRNEDFQGWHASCGGITDFRMHMTFHAAFLRDQAYSISGQEGFDSSILIHPVWTEIGAGKFVEDEQSQAQYEQTVVTPNVGSAFTQAFPKWRPGKFDLLFSVPPSEMAAAHQDSRQKILGLPNKFPAVQTSTAAPPNVALLLEQAAMANKTISKTASEMVGKVVVVRPSPALNTAQLTFRFALVQETTKSGKALRVIWLTLPSSTICGSEYDRAYYPVTHELFFSDQCNCQRVPINSIVAIHDTAVFPDIPENDDNIIIQLLYREEDAAFVTGVESELLCTCQQGRRKKPLATRPKLQDSTQQIPKLRNMSLFSGCGLLDYSLEESGHIETGFALDHNEMAIRSHAANSQSDKCTHVVGSVNVHLAHFLEGKATMPEVDCITAGCPCKGFSLLNAHRKKLNAQRNCSLLASTLSWIDLFKPSIALIENVTEMDSVPADTDLANACAQAICCLVAMGYQVRKMILTAYEHGSPTGRRRLFLVAAAPGMPLPDVPEPTHGRDADLKPVATVGDVLEDLSPIHNDTVVNVTDPSHIPIQRLKPSTDWGISLRNVVGRIPKIPGEGLVQAFEKGLLSKEQRKWYYGYLSDEKKGAKSKTLRRVDPNNPFKTIVTVISPLDSRFGGEIVHPFEDRVLSLKEIRRAQGVPDWFLLVGNLRQQVELTGNAVAWQVGKTLGQSLGHAWRKFHNAGTGSGPANGAHLAEKIFQLPQTTTMAFTETTQTVKENDSSGKPKGTHPSQGKQSQTAHLETMLRHQVTAELPDGNTLEVKPESRSSMSPTPEVQSDGRLSGSRSPSEEIFDISDHESLVVAPDGSYNYHRSQRGKISRRTSSAKPTKKLVPMVIIPPKKQMVPPTRSSSIPFHPKPTKRAVVKEDDSDSDIEFLKSRPIVKKVRLSARADEWD